jgi:hypothetical protein
MLMGTVTMKLMKRLNQILTISSHTPMLFDGFTIQNATQSDHTSIKRNASQIKFLNKFNYEIKPPISTPTRPFYGYKPTFRCEFPRACRERTPNLMKFLNVASKTRGSSRFMNIDVTPWRTACTRHGSKQDG